MKRNVPVYVADDAVISTIEPPRSIVFLRFDDSGLNFNRTYEEYVRGFGTEDGECWLGLDELHRRTEAGTHILRIDLNHTCCYRMWAVYNSFSVGSKKSGYTLHLSEYDHRSNLPENGLRTTYWPTLFSGKKFATYDKDTIDNCAAMKGGGGWYGTCYSVTHTNKLISVNVTLIPRSIN